MYTTITVIAAIQQVLALFKNAIPRISKEANPHIILIIKSLFDLFFSNAQ